jgi:type II secretory pathway component PulC
LLRWMTGALLFGGVISGLIFVRTFRALSTVDPRNEVPHKVGAGGMVFSSAPVTGILWNAMTGRSVTEAAPGQTGTAEPFRLAGTFSVENGAGAPRRKAILDDLRKREQYIAGEGQQIGDVTVSKVYYDHVTLQGVSGTREVWLEFASRNQTRPDAGQSNQVVAAGDTGGTNRFDCIQVGENRWQFSRKPLMDYYQELLDEPERMVAIFDTMKPVRDERNKITGYVVGVEGEKDFFDAVGLRQGDIVRTVNSVPMTNRKRAEFFIDEFLKDNMSAVVMDVERGGQTVKQVYQLRQ